MFLDTTLEYFYKIPQNYIFALQIFSIILTTGIVNFFTNKYINKLTISLKKTNRIYDDIIAESISLPLKLAIWAVGLYGSICIIGIKSNLISQIKDIVSLGIFVLFLIKFTSKLELRLEEKIDKGDMRLNKTTLRALGQLVKAAIIITTILTSLQVFGVPISGVLAVSGIGGIGIAFAAKDLLANFFGGLMIYLDRPFEVGDWIRSPDKEIEGTVEHIGWRLTSIRTFDQRLRYVPNNLFSVITIDNPSRMRNRRIKTLIGLRYEDTEKIADIIKAIKTMLLEHEDIDNRRIMLVNLVEFGPSSLNFQVYTFTKTVDWAEYLNIQQDVFLRILDIIRKFNAKCALPARSVYFNSADQDDIQYNNLLAEEG